MSNQLDSKQYFKQTSDTLVLHPSDRSTDFLTPIYDRKKWDVLRYPAEISEAFQKFIMKKYDRIVMMGHGSPSGLFGAYSWRNKRSSAIDKDFVDILKKVPTVCIWCNADQFVLKHNLFGLYTGMAISEVGEAAMFDIQVSQRVIDESNNLFTEAFRQNIEIQNPSVIDKMLKVYDKEDNPVIQFNRERIYYR